MTIHPWAAGRSAISPHVSASKYYRRILKSVTILGECHSDGVTGPALAIGRNYWIVNQVNSTVWQHTSIQVGVIVGNI